MVLGRVRNLTSPGLSKHQSGSQDGIFASSESRSCSPLLSTTPQKIYIGEIRGKKKQQKKTQFQDRCLAVSGSLDHTCHLISLSPSFTLLFSLSLSLYVAFGSGQRNRMATVPSLADNFALFPSQRVTRHSLLGSESNHTSLTNRRPCSG